MQAYPYHRPSGTRDVVPITKSKAMSHLMPLNYGATVKDGPTRSVFSTPSFQYSPQTETLINDLMKESRLTFTQRGGLASILRKGEPLPVRPGDIYRQEMFRHRHAEKARQLGVSVLAPSFNKPQLPHDVQLFCKFGGGGRRTLSQIVDSGQLQPPSKEEARRGRRYIPQDKEKEKERLAHKMATGKDLPDPKPNAQPTNNEGLRGKGFFKRENDDEKTDNEVTNQRLLELVKEIKERVEFLEQMQAIGRGKGYHGPIIHQIQGLLKELTTIGGVEEGEEWVRLLGLEQLDPEAFLRVGGGNNKKPKFRSQVQSILMGDEND